MPHSFCLADSSDGRALVAQAGEGQKLPLVVFPDGTVLADPSNADLATAAGSPVNPERMDFDLVIVGAGPAGLSAAVYGASEGFSTLVVDEGGLGGQATSSSLIRNYLGFPGASAVAVWPSRRYEQAWVFGANFSFMQRVTDLRREDDDLFVTLSGGGHVRARAVLLATGASYRRIGIPALEALNGAGVFYGGPASEAPAMAGRRRLRPRRRELGRTGCAVSRSLRPAGHARGAGSVARRRDVALPRPRRCEATPNMEVRLGTEIVGGGGDGWLEHLVLRDRADGSEETVDADGLFLMIGARPHTEWLPAEVDRDARASSSRERTCATTHAWPLERTPLLLETSMPGVFAAGDVRHGSVKRVASAVGEGSVAIQLLHSLFEADRLQSARPSQGVRCRDRTVWRRCSAARLWCWPRCWQRATPRTRRRRS